ncbi:MAG: hypothetical protein WCP46_00505 [Alphaproteobacteria bacterium]
MTRKVYDVENFNYNGFMVQSKAGKANYTAQFKAWSNDPGILIADCSDGKERHIPSCCLIDVKREDLPEQDYENKIYFGQPSKS